jgi:hypothetical protein
MAVDRRPRGGRVRPVTIDTALPDAFERLSAIQPDAIVLDLGTAPPEPVIMLWKTRPELLLIAVDLDSDLMLVLSGQPARALTAEGLIETLTARNQGQEQGAMQ